jgi:plasmid stabilization system protein ParE
VVEIRFHPEAREEYQLAYEWYLARSPQAAVKFEAELDRVLASIEASPGLFPAYDDHHRFATLRRYPYSVVYQQVAGQLVIVALAHSRRSAGYWQGRV